MRRLLALGVSITSLLGIAATPSHAETTLGRECLVSGTAKYSQDVNDPSKLDWVINGSGACGNQKIPVGPVETVSISGAGISDGFLDCGSTGTIGLGADQGFVVAATYTDTTAPFTVTHELQTWTAPLVAPLATVFLAQPSSGGAGVGVLSTHIFFQCGNDRQHPSAVYTWVLGYPG